MQQRQQQLSGLAAPRRGEVGRPTVGLPGPIVIVSPTDGQRCGIAYFARSMARSLVALGLPAQVVRDVDQGVEDVAVVVVHHHSELMTDADVAALCERVDAPVVVFAHEPGGERFEAVAAGISSVGRLGEGRRRFVRPHPAWVPDARASVGPARRARGLDPDRLTIGSNGFLRFERRFPDLLGRLLPVAAAEGWQVVLHTSPWKEDSPGELERIDAVARRHPGTLLHIHRHLPAEEVTSLLQLCDLLWTWTDVPSSGYGSGVLSDQYASGSRVVAPDKEQYAPVLALPDAVTAPEDLDGFVAALVTEARRLGESITRGDPVGHDPAILSWDRFTRDLVAFLGGLGGEPGAAPPASGQPEPAASRTSSTDTSSSRGSAASA